MGIICPNELEVISGRILLALPSLFEDISSAVRSAAIDAAAHVARFFFSFLLLCFVLFCYAII